MDQSLYIANALQKQFGLILKTPNRGVKQAGFLVLRQSSMPSVLIEAGFLSNQTEANYLNSQIGQQEIAQSIFEALSKFLNKNSNVKNTHPTDHSTALTDKNPQNVAKETIQNQAPPIDAKIKQAEVTSTTNISTEKRENPKIQNENEVKTSKVYYCVQIGASTTSLDPTPANFKGLKNVHRDKIDKYYRYYVGKEDTLKNAESILLQVKTKFPQAFIVSFVNGERVLIK
jgi:N-acetylmuramoyl-L-alanine amidase